MAITPEQARIELARRELARRGVPVEKSQMVAQSVPDAVRKALYSSSRNLVEDITGRGEGPIRQAKALPALAGTGLGLLGIPGGATVGTTGGRVLSNAALISYGRPEEMPSTESQVAEGALAALGDLTAIPALNRKIFGGQVGAAEKAAGVSPVQDIPSTPMATGSKSLGEFVNDAVRSVKDSGGRGTPEYWLQIKDQIDRIYELGKDSGLTRLDRGKLRFLNTAVQSGLNRAVPGRAVPAAALAESQRLPNTISRGVKNISRNTPFWLKVAAGTAAGTTPLWKMLGESNGR